MKLCSFYFRLSHSSCFRFRKKVRRSATDAMTILQKHFVSHHTTLWSSTSTVGRYAGTTTQGRWCTAQTLPIPITIPALRISCQKNPVFDGRVHIDLSTYHSLDESQKEMLKEHGLIVNIVN